MVIDDRLKVIPNDRLDSFRMTDDTKSKCPVCLGSGSISTKGTRFKVAREMCNLSRQELADACGLSHVTIRNVENGITSPSRGTLELIVEEIRSRGIKFIL